MTQQEKELGCFTATLRYFLMFVNILFILGGIAGMIVSIMMMTGEKTNILRFCSVCHNFSIYSIIVFGCIFLFSFLGFCALCNRNTCMLMLYAFVEIIFFLAALCVLIIVIMIHEGKFDRALHDGWNEQVQSDTSGICDFQMALNCTGWDSTCPPPQLGANGTYFYDNVTAVNCPICTPQQFAQLTSGVSCHTQVQNDINKYFWILVGSAAGLCALTLLAVIISCKVRVEYEASYDEYERF